MTPAEVARAAYAAYRAQDRRGAEALYAPEFRFTSPQDDDIDRAAWFDRCFPTADRFTRQELLHVVPDGDDVLVVYEYDLAGPEPATYRNAELIAVAGDRIVQAQVFFGGRVA